jgi:hypothetical protein
MVLSKTTQITFGMKKSKLLLLLLIFSVVGCIPYRGRITYSGIYSHNTPLYYNSHNGFLYNPIIIHTPYRRPQIKQIPPRQKLGRRRYGNR